MQGGWAQTTEYQPPLPPQGGGFLLPNHIDHAKLAAWNWVVLLADEALAGDSISLRLLPLAVNEWLAA